jgi:hypothetical protein
MAAFHAWGNLLRLTTQSLADVLYLNSRRVKCTLAVLASFIQT